MPSTEREGAVGACRGHVMIFLTTTAIQMDDELLNRCLAGEARRNRAEGWRLSPSSSVGAGLDELRSPAARCAHAPGGACLQRPGDDLSDPCRGLVRDELRSG